MVVLFYAQTKVERLMTCVFKPKEKGIHNMDFVLRKYVFGFGPYPLENHKATSQHSLSSYHDDGQLLVL